jgi:hypothetical protein
MRHATSSVFMSTLATLAGAACFAWASPAQAAPVTVAFAGTISSILSDDSSGAFGAAFAVGDAVSGTFTFDSAAVGVPAVGLNLTAYAATFSADINGVKVGGSTDYRIFNDAGPAQDGWNIVAENGAYAIDPTTPVGTLTASTFFLQFVGMPEATLADEGLVLNPAALTPLANLSYAPHGFRFDNRDGTFGGAYFNISSVTVVPEPGGLLLVALAGALAAAVRRRGAR